MIAHEQGFNKDEGSNGDPEAKTAPERDPRNGSPYDKNSTGQMLNCVRCKSIACECLSSVQKGTGPLLFCFWTR